MLSPQKQSPFTTYAEKGGIALAIRMQERRYGQRESRVGGLSPRVCHDPSGA